MKYSIALLQIIQHILEPDLKWNDGIEGDHFFCLLKELTVSLGSPRVASMSQLTESQFTECFIGPKWMSKGMDTRRNEKLDMEESHSRTIVAWKKAQI